MRLVNSDAPVTSFRKFPHQPCVTTLHLLKQAIQFVRSSLRMLVLPSLQSLHYLHKLPLFNTTPLLNFKKLPVDSSQKTFLLIINLITNHLHISGIHVNHGKKKYNNTVTIISVTQTYWRSNRG